jgi:flagellar basal-body rod modification protein FlgD
MTSPISSASPTPVAPNPALGNGATDNTQLNSQTFLRLLVAQLQYQDPSKPVDTSSFMNETATLTQVQAMEQSSRLSAELLMSQRAQSATNLVGHTVEYTAADGTTKTGLVQSATISVANPSLKIGNADIALTAVTKVLATTPPA